jgi:endogenous inhibitor of DNA gyrase (YacG/DUF329 family)
MRSCPICKHAPLPRAENPAFPFCSDRCKIIDLGKWFGESYRLPAKPGEQEDEPQLDSPLDLDDA